MTTNIFKIILAAICVVAIILIMSQEGKQNGLGSLGGVSTPTESYWGKNKGRSAESRIIKLTSITAAIVFGLCILLMVI